MRRKLATAEELVDYKRYKFTPDNVSPQSIPGMAGGVHTAEGLEHNEYGNPNYTGPNHEAMIAKRIHKIDDAWKYPMATERFGDENPDVLVVTWGSTKGPAKEAVTQALAEGKKVGYLVTKILNPLPREGFLDIIERAPEVIVAEMNYTGQLEGLLRKHIARDFVRLNKVQGSPVTWLEIKEKVEGVLAKQDHRPPRRRHKRPPRRSCDESGRRPVKGSKPRPRPAGIGPRRPHQQTSARRRPGPHRQGLQRHPAARLVPRLRRLRCTCRHAEGACRPQAGAA